LAHAKVFFRFIGWFSHQAANASRWVAILSGKSGSGRKQNKQGFLMYASIQRLVLINIFILMLLISSCTSTTLLKTPTPVSTPTRSIETLQADPSYMAECKKINRDIVDEQASYKGIYPGRTTQDEVRNVFGKPLRVPQIKEIIWEYGDRSVVFDKSKVSKLYVFGDNATTLKDLILQYGCPDGIYALDTSVHAYGDYSRLVFFYHRIGFQFSIGHNPAKLNDTVDQMTYFMPGTLDDYKNTFRFFSVPNSIKLMTWDEALR